MVMVMVVVVVVVVVTSDLSDDAEDIRYLLELCVVEDGTLLCLVVFWFPSTRPAAVSLS